ncbi:MAG: CcmD family protein [Cytophagales bacterium]|nr:CcmD family protein [Cytophagales bacterium]MDW8384998.1 CcmD family protein [Flammeovirgaceae bacterium]
MRKIALVFFLCWLNLHAWGKEYPIAEADYQNQAVEMADMLRANGKIYVVVAVITAIFIGIVLYLWKLDKKISQLEKDNNN